MRHLWSFLRLVVLTAIIGYGALGAPQAAHATHFRYGHLTWQRVTQTKASFTLTCAFARSQYRGRASDGYLAVGDRFIENIGGTTLDFGDGSAFATGPGGGGLLFQAVAIDVAKDYVIGRALDPSTQRDRITHQYAAPNNAGNPWVANIDSCCRILQLNNNPSGEYRVETYVDLSAAAGSPVSALPPIIPVSQGGGSFFVPAVDQEGNTLLYRLADSVEGGGGTFAQPPGVAIDPVTGQYTVPNGLQTGLWSTQVIIEQYDSSGILIGKVGVDFILQVLANVTTNAPYFNTPPTPINGYTITAPVGREVSMLISASDPDNNAVTLNTTGVPLGAKQVASLPVTGLPAVSSFDWTPTLADVGAYSITYTAEDGNGNIAITSVNLRVIEGVDLIEPNGGESYVAGQQQTVYWNSKGNRRAGGFQLRLSTDGGATYPLVVAASVPDNSSLSQPGFFAWTPTLSMVSKTCKMRLVNRTDPADYGESLNVFSITTDASPPICTSPNQATGIPDYNVTGITVPIVVTEDRLIRGLSIQINAVHPFIGDLDISLKGPDFPNDPGPTVRLKRQTGLRGETLDKPFGYGYAFQAPEDSLTVFYGRRSKGTWLLTIRDLIQGDVGTFNSACITVTGPFAGKFSLTSPNGGERWAVGTVHNITWSNQGVIGTANVDVSRDAGQTWTTIASLPAGLGSYPWQVLGPETNQARVRIISADDPAQYVVSAGNFQIANPFVSISQPTTGQTISAGKIFNITWDEVPTDPNVNVEFSTNGGMSWAFVQGPDPGDVPAQNIPNSGSFAWFVPKNLNTSTARVRVTPVSGPAMSSPAVTGDFTIQASGVNVSAPADQDVWYTYTTHTITWSTVGVSGNVTIQLSRNGTSWESLFTNVPNTGTKDWVVTGPGSESAQIRVLANDGTGLTGTSGTFRIRDMSVTVSSPNGGEVWGIGSTQNITWSSAGVPGNVDILLSRDGGKTFNALFTDVPNGGTHAWTVTGPDTDPSNPQGPNSGGIIKVQAHGYPAFDVSDQSFRIVTPTINLVTPIGGELWRVGQTYDIVWNTIGVTGQVDISVSRDGGTSWQTLFSNVSNQPAQGQTNVTQSWTVTGPDSSTALIRVSSPDTGASATSPAPFQIATPSINLISPSGGEVWYTGTRQSISWTSVGIDGNVKIEVSRNGSWETISGSAPNTGNFDWTVTSPAATSATIRVTSLTNPNASGSNAAPFRIVEPTIQIGSPFGGEEWLTGTQHSITWVATGPVGSLTIELSRNNGSTWETIANVSNSGSYNWTVNGPVTTAARVRVRSLDRPTVSDQSHSTFTISAPNLTVTAPANKAKAKIGTAVAITWTGSVVRAGGGTVNIYLSTNGGNTFDPTPILSNLPNRGNATWFVTGKPIKKAKIKVVWNPDPSVSGVSPGTFQTTKGGK